MDGKEPQTQKERRPLPEPFERVWHQALLAVSTAEDEVSRVVQRVGALAGWSQEEAKRHVRELTERLTQQRRELERVTEDAVRRAVGRVRAPRREELQQLQERLERVARRIEALAVARDVGGEERGNPRS